MSINSLAIDQREQFFEEHGDCIRHEHHFLFEDGSIVEDSPMALLQGPPSDPFECAKNVTLYHRVCAERATEAFEEFKSWLQGDGKRRDEWAQLYTDEDRLEHLRALQNRARLLRSRYARHRRELERMTPEWMQDMQDADIEQQTQSATFQSAVESIKL